MTSRNFAVYGCLRTSPLVVAGSGARPKPRSMMLTVFPNTSPVSSWSIRSPIRSSRPSSSPESSCSSLSVRWGWLVWGKKRSASASLAVSGLPRVHTHHLQILLHRHPTRTNQHHHHRHLCCPSPCHYPRLEHCCVRSQLGSGLVLRGQGVARPLHLTRTLCAIGIAS